MSVKSVEFYLLLSAVGNDTGGTSSRLLDSPLVFVA